MQLSNRSHHFFMASKREETIKAVAKALTDKAPTAEYETSIANEFGEFVKNPLFAALPLPFLLKIVRSGGRRVTPDAICQLFVDNVPYSQYPALQLLETVNFSNVSTSVLLQMREVAMEDGLPMRLPLVIELVNLRAALNEAQQCGGPRIHEYNASDICIRCNNGRCPYGRAKGGLTNVHQFDVDGRCSICGVPRCNFDNLHPFNYDGHCHICGKAQPSKCEIVGCQASPDGKTCAICGKALVK
jgi:hypothetical protein